MKGDALPMSTSIGQNNFVNQLEDMVRSFVQEKLETVMKEEMDQLSIGCSYKYIFREDQHHNPPKYIFGCQ